MKLRLVSMGSSNAFVCVIVLYCESSAYGLQPRDTPMGRSSTIENKQISIAPAEAKLPSTLKVTVQGSLRHNHVHGIKEAETVVGGTQIFSKRPSESKNDSARMKKVDAVMAFRPSSSGHSPGIGHDDPPDPMF